MIYFRESFFLLFSGGTRWKGGKIQEWREDQTRRLYLDFSALKLKRLCCTNDSTSVSLENWRRHESCNTWACPAKYSLCVMLKSAHLPGGWSSGTNSTAEKSNTSFFLNSSLWNSRAFQELLFVKQTIKLLWADGESDKQVVRDSKCAPSCRLMAKVYKAKTTVFMRVVLFLNAYV